MKLFDSLDNNGDSVFPSSLGWNASVFNGSLQIGG
jgi:hypothetical protein